MPTRRPPTADAEARSRADGVLNPPEGSDHLVVQVDGTVLEGASVEVEGDGRPHEPLVASLERLARALPPPARDARRAGAGRRSVRRAQRRCLDRRSAGLRAPRRAARGARADHSRPGCRRGRSFLPHADRPRGGRGGRGLGAVAFDRLESGLALQHGDRDLGGAGREPPLRHRPGAERAQLGLRHPAGRGGTRRELRLGGSRFRLRPRQGPDGDPAGRARDRAPA